MKKLITLQKCSFSENTNKHCVLLKNPHCNTEVKEDTAVPADAHSDSRQNQSSVGNPSTDTNTNNNNQNQDQYQHQ